MEETGTIQDAAAAAQQMMSQQDVGNPRYLKQ